METYIITVGGKIVEEGGRRTRVGGRKITMTAPELRAKGWTQCEGCKSWYPRHYKLNGLCAQCVAAEAAWGT